MRRKNTKYFNVFQKNVEWTSLLTVQRKKEKKRQFALLSYTWNADDTDDTDDTDFHRCFLKNTFSK